MRRKTEIKSKLGNIALPSVALISLFIVSIGVSILSPVMAEATSAPTPLPTPKWLAELEESCDAGSMLDCQAVAHTYGLGVYKRHRIEKNLEKANLYIKRIVEMGREGCVDNANLERCHLLGLMYFEGMAIDRDVIKGMALVNKSCAAGYKVACTWLHNKGVR